jgi:hypothetical protein
MAKHRANSDKFLNNMKLFNILPSDPGERQAQTSDGKRAWFSGRMNVVRVRVRSEAAHPKLLVVHEMKSSGNAADTTTFGISTSSLILRSTATLQMA